MFNTLPYNSFPASTAKFEEGKNDAIQAEIDAIKDGTNIDSFGDVETALSLKANSADMETALATKTNLSNVAPTFDAESGTYDIGEKVIYEGVLYEFISEHDTPGDWDNTEVQAVKISELIDTLNSNLNGLKNLNNLYFSFTATDMQDYLSTVIGYVVSNFDVGLTINAVGVWQGVCTFLIQASNTTSAQTIVSAIPQPNNTINKMWIGMKESDTYTYSTIDMTAVS